MGLHNRERKINEERGEERVTGGSLSTGETGAPGQDLRLLFPSGYVGWREPLPSENRQRCTK